MNRFLYSGTRWMWPSVEETHGAGLKGPRCAQGTDRSA